MTVEHFVKYLYPGYLFPEESSFRLDKRDETEALEKLPHNAFAFELYDVEVRAGVLEDGQPITDRKVVNKSDRYYPDAKVYGLPEIAAEFGNNSILYHNMEYNGWDRVIKTRCGNFQPLKAEDTLCASVPHGTAVTQ